MNRAPCVRADAITLRIATAPTAEALALPAFALALHPPGEQTPLSLGSLSLAETPRDRYHAVSRHRTATAAAPPPPHHYRRSAATAPLPPLRYPWV